MKSNQKIISIKNIATSCLTQSNSRADPITMSNVLITTSQLYLRGQNLISIFCQNITQTTYLIQT